MLRTSLILIAATACPASAKEHIVPVSWDASGAFRAELSVAPKKFKEVCVGLKKGERVKWTFAADGPMDFNIHYHQGNDVLYPARQADIASSDGELVVPLDQDYCWMWKSGERASRLSVSLRKGA